MNAADAPKSVPLNLLKPYSEFSKIPCGYGNKGNGYAANCALLLAMDFLSM